MSVLNKILQKSGLKSSIAGNIGIPVLSINTDEFDIIILEVSSFQLELIDQFRAKFKKLPPEDIAFPRTASNVQKYKAHATIYEKWHFIQKRMELLKMLSMRQ